MNPFDTKELSKARDLLLAGDVVAVPTETVYGLAASIESEAGLRKVFSLKERPFFDPLIVHVASIKQAQSLVVGWSPLADFLTRLLWPGPFTIVLPKAAHVNPLITSGLLTVAIRYPAHPIALDLIRLIGHPLAAPSANRFGRTSPSRAEHVESEFPNSNLLILNGGACDVGIESTVVTLLPSESEGGPEILEILRPGGISEAELRETLSKWGRPVLVRAATSAASPGHLRHHYMPNVPLVIIGADEPDAGLTAKLEKALKKKLRRAGELILDHDPAIAARELYSQLRDLSEGGCDAIYVRAPKTRDQDLSAGIWDRLGRAATVNLNQKDPL